MKVGVPTEVKPDEYRVAITPAGVHELVRDGHEVYIQQDAGTGSSIPDAEFVAAGGQILPTADAVWQTGDLHNGVAAVGILAAYAARMDGFAALRRPDSPER